MKFIPKNVGMTKNEVLEMLNDHIEVLNDMAADNGVTTRVPKLKMEALSDKDAQRFVDEEYDLMSECDGEEYMIEQREDLIRKVIDKVMK